MFYIPLVLPSSHINMGTLPLRLSIREPQWAQVLPCLPWHAAGCCTMRSPEAGGGLKEPRAGRVHSQPAVSRPFQRIIQAQTHLKDSQWPQILRGELQSPLGPKAVHLRGLRVPHSPLPTRRLCQDPLCGGGRSLGQFSSSVAHGEGVSGTPVLSPLLGLALVLSLLWGESLFSLAGASAHFKGCFKQFMELLVAGGSLLSHTALSLADSITFFFFPLRYITPIPAPDQMEPMPQASEKCSHESPEPSA